MRNDEMGRAVRFNEQQARMYGDGVVEGLRQVVKHMERGSCGEDIAREVGWTVEDARAAWRYALRAQAGRETMQEQEQGAIVA